LGLEDEYELGATLGEGSGGTVRAATRRRDGRAVALKLVGAEASLPQARERLLAEARLLARVRSPHVVEVLDLGEEGDRAWVAMARLPGRSLAARLAAEGPLPPAAAAQLVAGAARGLAALHEAGVVHRDVKPDNILEPRPGHAVLVDLGLALGCGRGLRTRTGVLLGTPGFFAPELLGGEAAGPPADVFALGVTLYWLLTGRSPYPGEEPGELLRAQLGGVPAAALRRLSEGPRAWVEALLDPDPGTRPEAAAAAELLARTAPTSRRRAPPAMEAARPSPPPPRAAPRRRALGPVLLLLGCLGLGALWEALRAAPPEPAPLPVDPAARVEAWLHVLEDFTLEAELVALAGGDEAVPALVADLDHQAPGVGNATRPGRALRAPTRIRTWRAELATRPWWGALQTLLQALPSGWWGEVPPGAAAPPARRLRWRLLRQLQRVQALARVEARLHRAGPLVPGLDAFLAGAVRAKEVPGPTRAEGEAWLQAIPGACISLVDQTRPEYPEGLIKLQQVACPGSLCTDRPWHVARAWNLPPPADGPWVGAELGVLDLHPTGLPTLQVRDRSGRPQVEVAWRPLESLADFQVANECVYRPLWVRWAIRRELLPPGASLRLVYRELLAPLDARIGNPREEFVTFAGVDGHPVDPHG